MNVIKNIRKVLNNAKNSKSLHKNLLLFLIFLIMKQGFLENSLAFDIWFPENQFYVLTMPPLSLQPVRFLRIFAWKLEFIWAECSFLTSPFRGQRDFHGCKFPNRGLFLQTDNNARRTQGKNFRTLHSHI